MEKKTLSFGSSLVAVILSLGTIIVGKLWLSLNTTIVLLLSATVVSCFVVLKGVKWSDIETEISAGIKGMGTPIVVLLETGILVGVDGLRYDPDDDGLGPQADQPEDLPACHLPDLHDHVGCFRYELGHAGHGRRRSSGRWYRSRHSRSHDLRRDRRWLFLRR